MDYLWVYTSIAGAILGAAALAYVKETKLGIWGYGKFDQVLDYIRDRFGWTWFDQPVDAWKSINPQIAQKLDELESRIKELEK